MQKETESIPDKIQILEREEEKKKKSSEKIGKMRNN